MTEILDDVASLEIKGEGTNRTLILCNRLERFDYGIIGFKIIKRPFVTLTEQILTIHTNVIKENEDEFKKRKEPGVSTPDKGETILKAEFNSIKEVLDSLGIIIHWKN